MTEPLSERFHERLVAVLDEGVQPVTASEARLLAENENQATMLRLTRRLPTGRRLAVLSALCMVTLAVIGSIAYVGLRHTGRPRVAGETLLRSTTGPCAGQPPGCGSQESSSTALSHGSWTTFPTGPLTPRFGQAEVWTGKELIVWGGFARTRAAKALGNGAAYDPATGRWHLLPDSPLPPEGGAAALWTGREMVIIGGNRGDNRASSAVEAFVPATDTWHRLPPLPRGEWAGLTALWTGRQIVVIGPRGDDLAAFNPATNSWTSLPRLPEATPPYPNWQLIFVVPVWTGTSLDAFVTWQRSPPCGHGCFALQTTVVAWSLRAGTQGWSPLPSPTVQLGSAVAAWTGRGVIVAGGTYCPRSCPPPIPLAALYSASSRKWLRALGDGAVSNWPGLWTGKAFISVHGPGRGPTADETLGAWNPGKDSWTSLPTSQAVSDVINGGGGGNPAIWTGRDLLIWGSPGIELVVPPPR